MSTKNLFAKLKSGETVTVRPKVGGVAVEVRWVRVDGTLFVRDGVMNDMGDDSVYAWSQDFEEVRAPKTERKKVDIPVVKTAERASVAKPVAKATKAAKVEKVEKTPAKKGKRR